MQIRKIVLDDIPFLVEPVAHAFSDQPMNIWAFGRGDRALRRGQRLTDNGQATSEEFLNYMLELYNRTDMQNRFPDAYKLIEMALAEMK
jgi:hypothetical protein